MFYFCRYIFSVLLLFIFFTGCSDNSPTTLIVFAGAGLKEVFEEAGKAFEDSHENVRVVFNFAGSPKLIAQIKEGARGDIIAFPGEIHMKVAVENSLVFSGNERVFARNKLVIVYSKNSNREIKSIYDLLLPGLKIDMADRSVPIGDYTMKMLESIEKSPDFEEDFKEKFLENVVSYEDNVKSVVNKVVLGEADAGVVYYSDITGKVLESAGVIEIPGEINQDVIFSIAPLKEAGEPEIAEEFINFILSPEGQQIVEDHGFIPVKAQ